MQFSALLMPTLAALASAQSTTVISIFEAFDKDNPFSITNSMAKSLGGSIISTNVNYTTYEFQCMSGAPTTDCSFEAPYTVLAGPTTLSYAKPLPFKVGGAAVTIHQDVHCSFTRESESARCTNTYSTSSGGRPTVTTQSYGTEDVFYYPVTITAGGSLSGLPQPTQTSTSNAAAGAYHPMVTAAPLALAAAALL